MSLDVAMIAADTTRTRAYLSAMLRNGVLPSFILVLKNANENRLAGQADRQVDPVRMDGLDPVWSEAAFDIAEPLEELLHRVGVPYAVAASHDINDARVVEAITERPEQVFVYSGFGGALLRLPVLSIGKRFLHVHGGALPAFKGSTTNYFSLLVENTMGASAIFLTADIDCGPILGRRVFPPPPERRAIDHVFDSAARAKVLVDVLIRYREQGNWHEELENTGGETYYVIHPVLKTIAVLAEDSGE